MWPLRIERLQSNVDTLIVIPNDRLLQVVQQDASILDAFKVADDVLRHGVRAFQTLSAFQG